MYEWRGWEVVGAGESEVVPIDVAVGDGAMRECVSVCVRGGEIRIFSRCYVLDCPP